MSPPAWRGAGRAPPPPRRLAARGSSGRRNSAASLLFFMPTIRWAGRSDGQQCSASASPAPGLWPPSSHSSQPAGSVAGQPPVQALQPRRPLGAGQAARDRRGRQAAARPATRQRRCRRCRSGAARAAPAAARPARRPHPHRRARPPAGRSSSRGRAPAASRPPAPPRRAAPSRTTGVLRAGHARPPGFIIPAFSPAIASSVSPRKSRWSNDTEVIAAAAGRGDDVGRVVPSAQSHLQHHQLGRHAGEQQERRGGQQLEHGDRRAVVGPFHLVQRRGQRVVIDDAPGQADALVEAHQMRRGDIHAPASPPPRRWRAGRRRCCPCRWCRRHAPPAADGRSGWPSFSSSACSRPEAEVDQPRVQRMQPLHHRGEAPCGGLSLIAGLRPPGRAPSRSAAAAGPAWRPVRRAAPPYR